MKSPRAASRRAVFSGGTGRKRAPLEKVHGATLPPSRVNGTQAGKARAPLEKGKDATRTGEQAPPARQRVPPCARDSPPRTVHAPHGTPPRKLAPDVC